MPRRCPRRPAFSFVEAMVCIAVLIVLLGLGFPAIQQLRIGMQQGVCKNNLRQMGLALHAYNEINYSLPPAFKSDGYNPGWSWSAMILPYLDQKTIYDTAGVNVAIFGSGGNPAYPTEVMQTTIQTFRCPADPAPDLNGFRLNYATSNYRAVAGPTTNQWFVANQDMGGVFFQNSRVALDEIPDGASYTFAIGECIYDEPTQKWAAQWAGMSGLRGGAVYISDAMWWIDENTAVINGPAPQAFSSRHGRGAHFLYCDGSVRFMYEGGDVSVIKYLAGRNDGVIVNFTSQ